MIPLPFTRFIFHFLQIMIVPISFKIPDSVPMDPVHTWLRDNDLFHEFTWDWHKHILSFDNEETAIAFSLTFGIQRYRTLVEQKLANEESNN